MVRKLATFHTAAGWVPYDEERSADADDEAAELLIDAFLGQCQGHEPPVLVATTLRGDGHGVVAEFGRRYGVTSYRDRQGYGRGPALAYMPDARALEYATQMAHSSPIAVIEGMHLAMRGWAVATQAVNILSPDTPAEEFPDSVREDLERLEFYKNNAWGDPLGKQVALQCLGRIRGSGFTDRGSIKSWLIAHGASGRRFEKLDRAMDDLGFPEGRTP